MCVHFTPATRTSLKRLTGQELEQTYQPEAYPSYAVPILMQGMRIELALFGLIPHWSKNRLIGRKTYNARSETISEKPSYRKAWAKGQFCLVPMEGFYEPCWETKKAVPWRIHRKNNEAFCVLGIYDHWIDLETGELVPSFSMLTINADAHPLMNRFHPAGDEKRSLVVVNSRDYDLALNATAERAKELLVPIEVKEFTATNSSQSQAEPQLSLLKD